MAKATDLSVLQDAGWTMGEVRGNEHAQLDLAGVTLEVFALMTGFRLEIVPPKGTERSYIFRGDDKSGDVLDVIAEQGPKVDAKNYQDLIRAMVGTGARFNSRSGTII